MQSGLIIMTQKGISNNAER